MNEIEPLALVPPLGPLAACCAEFASVVACDGVTDHWTCMVCGAAWDAPCRPSPLLELGE